MLSQRGQCCERAQRVTDTSGFGLVAVVSRTMLEGSFRAGSASRGCFEEGPVNSAHLTSMQRAAFDNEGGYRPFSAGAKSARANLESGHLGLRYPTNRLR